jgi:hypothetical protein
LDRPLIIPARNDGEAVGFGTLPAGAKAGTVRFSSAGAFLPDFPRGWRVIFPSGVKVILNCVPLVVEAVNALPSKKQALEFSFQRLVGHAFS